MIEDKDLDYLQKIFDGRYRKISDCDDITESIVSAQSRDNVRLAVIENQLKAILWVLTATGGGVIAMLIKMFFGG